MTDAVLTVALLDAAPGDEGAASVANAASNEVGREEAVAAVEKPSRGFTVAANVPSNMGMHSRGSEGGGSLVVPTQFRIVIDKSTSRTESRLRLRCKLRSIIIRRRREVLRK